MTFDRVARLLLLALLCSALATASACGIDQQGTAPAPSSDGGAQDGATQEGGASSSSGGGGGDGGGGGVVDGGVNPPGAGPGGDGSALPCGGATCSLATQVCCVSSLGSGVRAYACVTGSTCPGSRTAALRCSGAANCPAGQVCCVRQIANDSRASECKAQCPGDEPQLCDPSAPDGGGCAASDPCSSNNISDWRLSPPYATCGGKGD